MVDVYITVCDKNQPFAAILLEQFLKCTMYSNRSKYDHKKALTAKNQNQNALKIVALCNSNIAQSHTKDSIWT